MPIIILIVFSYHATSLRDELTGARKDLNFAYNWAISFPASVYLITDFVTILKHRNITGTYIIHNKKEFYETWKHLMATIAKEEPVFCYYSGHGILSGEILLPDENSLSFNFLKKELLNKQRQQIFFLFDCCYPGKLNLPYVLDRQKFTLTTEKEFSNTAIVLFCSLSENNRVISSRDGSFFSHSFFSLLLTSQPKLHSWKELRDIINEQMLRSSNITQHLQTVGVFSTSEQLILWPWLNTNLQSYFNHLEVDKELGYIYLHKR